MSNRSTGDVLDRHLKAFAAYDLDGVLVDYSSDAVLFSPAGPLRRSMRSGCDQALFQEMIAEFAKPGSWFQMQQSWIAGDHACIVWNAETADNWYESLPTRSLCGRGR
jgi:ketosteroid isomerase-like protein